ncbi:hypothetical protein [Dethiosulfatarculus sandiegensis]|uniref:Uncharacterized protein n=1 Tax=Dethiosulfatarculus sandiegensis TaxID=1429043 RepID=A0A0D2HQG6_9BACT|nr:hypothetical protein [Dethiosulfatarculus sandiegensis]KIX12728.1 hypothetical protein X474_17630 [Dethiosulfatarculus sandiegensis]
MKVTKCLLNKKEPTAGKNAGPKIWHYTIWPNLLSILDEKEIKPLTLFSRLPEEMPSAWFSIHPDWELTVRKSIPDPVSGEMVGPLGRKALVRMGCPVARIQVDPELPFGSWTRYSPLSGLPKYVKRKIKNQAKRFGARRGDWRVLFAPVSSENWMAVEVYQDKNWIDLEDFLQDAEPELTREAKKALAGVWAV